MNSGGEHEKTRRAIQRMRIIDAVIVAVSFAALAGNIWIAWSI